MNLRRMLRSWLAQGVGEADRRVATVPASTPVPRPVAVEATIGETAQDQALKIMVQEVADLTKAMRELLMTADRFVYFAGIVAAAALTLGVIRHDEGNNWVILVFAPYGMCVAFGYLVQVYTEVERRAGYKAYLESRINKLVAIPLLLESHVNSRSARNRWSVVGMQVLNFAGFAALVCLSWRETWDRYADEGPVLLGFHLWNLHALNAVFLVVAVAVLVLAVNENRVASERAREAAEAAECSQ